MVEATNSGLEQPSPLRSPPRVQSRIGAGRPFGWRWVGQPRRRRRAGPEGAGSALAGGRVPQTTGWPEAASRPRLRACSRLGLPPCRSSARRCRSRRVTPRSSPRASASTCGPGAAEAGPPSTHHPRSLRARRRPRRRRCPGPWPRAPAPGRGWPPARTRAAPGRGGAGLDVVHREDTGTGATNPSAAVIRSAMVPKTPAGGISEPWSEKSEPSEPSSEN